MIQYSKFWGWLSWPLVRAHLCSLAISVTYNGTWRGPREGFRFGGVPYGLAMTLSLVLVALPITLLQLAVGQLSQQDAVGIWRAVPFFTGIGYIRLLISFVAAAYSMIYLSLAVAYFLYSATHDIPFIDCKQLLQVEEEYLITSMNASECLRITFMSPVYTSLEYYLAVALIIAVLWIVSPFVFYSSVKLMKRIMYFVIPIIIIIGVVIASCIGDGGSLSSVVKSEDWKGFLEPYIWNSALMQALWSTQVAGGFLIAAGDSVYASTSVIWSSIVITCTNIVSSWFWLIVWYSISGQAEKDTSSVAVLVQMYQAAMDKELSQAWPLLVFFTLILSGVITMLVFLYPVYEHLRRIGGIKWRVLCFGCSLVGIAVSLATLAGRMTVLTLLEDLAVPLLVSVATVLEILALVFVYGWRNLVEDVEFLISYKLLKFWVWGWWIAPTIIAPITTWWLAVLLTSQVEDDDASTVAVEGITVLASAVVASAVLLLCAGIAVGRQVQYDILEKLKSSFRPSRHWGPRDPITHYYWLARREALDRGYVPQTRYNRRELGQLSRRISFLTNTSGQSYSVDKNQFTFDAKLRSNSDDWLYTTSRKDIMEIYTTYEKRRSKSLDCDMPRKSKLKSRVDLSKENNNNTVEFKYDAIV